MSELTLMQLRNLKVMLTEHEGDKDKLYFDSVAKKWTIGIGRNLTDRKLEKSVIDLMFSNDVNYFNNALSKNYSWFDELNDARRMALIDMCFMGLETFKTFNDMIAAFEKHDYETAAKEIIDSDYGRSQYTGNRARELAEIIKTGSLNEFIKGRNLHGILAA
jgi:lysozyme